VGGRLPTRTAAAQRLGDVGGAPSYPSRLRAPHSYYMLGPCQNPHAETIGFSSAPAPPHHANLQRERCTIANLQSHGSHRTGTLSPAVAELKRAACGRGGNARGKPPPQSIASDVPTWIPRNCCDLSLPRPPSSADLKAGPAEVKPRHFTTRKYGGKSRPGRPGFFSWAGARRIGAASSLPLACTAGSPRYAWVRRADRSTTGRGSGRPS
jgi:hypothetical protein